MLKSNAVIFGLEGKQVSDKELDFFKDINPLGFILFARNIDTPNQVKSLVSDLKDIVGWNCPILIDQEGGRVARLQPPHWRKFPAMGKFAELAKTNFEQAQHDVYENALEIGRELINLGINVDCAPVCDLLFCGAHDIVGDRSFGSDVDTVSKLARKTAQGLLDSGVLPVIKHIPGHGRALSDSHKELPVVNEDFNELRYSDFKVFENLNNMPWAMTAHILYSSIDEQNPATLSTKIIDIIRKDIGFSGFLISDDLSMEALEGSYTERTINSINAGCDAVLHCNGKFEEMISIAKGVGELTTIAKKRLEDSMQLIKSIDDKYNDIDNKNNQAIAN